MKKILLVLLAVIPLSAQIKMTGLEGLEAKAKESVEVGLDSSMIKLAEGVIGKGGADGAKVRALLAGLKSITVRSFEFGEAGQYKPEDLTSIREQLRAPGWSRIINIKGKDEIVEIYTRSEQGKMAGLVVIAAEAKELAVVAIEGDIDLAALTQLGGQFGIPNIPIPGTSKGKEE